MKEYLASLVKQTATPVEGKNLVREYMQARILQSLQRAGAMIPLAFHDGTALRFLYASQRYSEDLDFSLVGDESIYDFHAYIRQIRADLTLENYTLSFKINDHATVNSAFIRFPGLLYEMGLSALKSEVF